MLRSNDDTILKICNSIGDPIMSFLSETPFNQNILNYEAFDEICENILCETVDNTRDHPLRVLYKTML